MADRYSKPANKGMQIPVGMLFRKVRLLWCNKKPTDLPDL